MQAFSFSAALPEEMNLEARKCALLGREGICGRESST
jgi:hypothetical protein